MLRESFGFLNCYSSMKISEIMLARGKSKDKLKWNTNVNNAVSNGKEHHILLIKCENMKNLILKNQFQLGVKYAIQRILTNQVGMKN